jgi:hypothetical protein
VTRPEFIEKYRYKIMGWVLDAALSGRKGADLALSLRAISEEISRDLGLMHEDAQTQQQPVKAPPVAPPPAATKGR